jgi:serine/threonine protein kinase
MPKKVTMRQTKLEHPTSCSEGKGFPVFQVVIRGEISKMVGLRGNGVVGIPVHRAPRNVWTEHSKDIILMVFQALKFAHNQLIYHLDVHPSNIIVSLNEGQCCAMLSNWEIAADGTTNKELLKQFLWLHTMFPRSPSWRFPRYARSRTGLCVPSLRTIRHLYRPNSLALLQGQPFESLRARPEATTDLGE